MAVSASARLGYFFIFLVAVDWILASYLVQDLERERVPPFIITTVCNSLFLLCLFVHWGNKWIDSSQSPIVRRLFGRQKRGGAPAALAPMPGNDVTDLQLLSAAACVCVFWFLGQFTFDASLDSTDVTSNTILSSTSTIWTFILAVVLGLDNYSLTKLLCVLVTFAGVSFVTLAGQEASSSEGHTGWGDFLAVCSALLYAVYTAIIKVALPSDERVSMMGFFGYLGLLNCLFSIPILFGLVYGGLLDTSGLTNRTMGLLVLKGLLDNVLSDYLWARAVLLTSPTVATCGTTIQVPISILADLLLGRARWAGSRVPATLMLGGGSLVLVGFFGVVSETPPDEELRRADGYTHSGSGSAREMVQSAAASLRRLRERGLLSGRRRRLQRAGSAARFVTTLEDIEEEGDGRADEEGGSPRARVGGGGGGGGGEPGPSGRVHSGGSGAGGGGDAPAGGADSAGGADASGSGSTGSKPACNPAGVKRGGAGRSSRGAAGASTTHGSPIQGADGDGGADGDDAGASGQGGMDDEGERVGLLSSPGGEADGDRGRGSSGAAAPSSRVASKSKSSSSSAAAQAEEAASWWW